MAMKLDAGPAVGRGDVFFVSPEFVIAEDDLNGRAAPHSEESINEMIESLLLYGQQQPAVARRVEGNKIKLVSGFRRRRAIQRINEQHRTTEPMPLQVRVSDMNDEEGYIRNLVENMHRDDLSPIDHAHNQRRLRERFGWDDGRIATFYQMSVSYVSQLRKTHQLPTEIQAEVQKGDLPLSTALDVANLPEQEQKKVLDEARDRNGKVNTAKVKQTVRQKKIEDGGKKARTVKEVKMFFEGLTGPGEDAGVRKLADLLTKFVAGSIEDTDMERKVRALFSSCELVSAS